MPPSSNASDPSRVSKANAAVHEARRAEAIPAWAAIPAEGGHW
jgi:hypothetical protein